MNKTDLERKLRQTIEGEVRFDAGTCAMYSTDASNYRQIPIGVVIPRTIDDVIQTVSVAREMNVPILSRGGGTSLAGQCCNVAVILDFSKYLRNMISLDAASRIAEVEPGIVLDRLRERAEQHNLTFGPDPASHSRCTLGGMIGNNSCGVHSVYSGKTEENVEELEVLTYNGLRIRVGKTSETELQKIIHEGGVRGEIYSRLKSVRDRYASQIRARFPNLRRRVSGYNLTQLLPENEFQVARALVGTEGTCVIVLKAVLRLVHSPPHRALVVLGYPDIVDGAEQIMEIMDHRPLALEGIDDYIVNAMKTKMLHPQNIAMLPEGNGWFLVEFGGETKEEAKQRAHKLIERLNQRNPAPAIRIFDNIREAAMIWRVRESGLGATAYVPGEKFHWEGWEDAAVPPEKVASYLRDYRDLMKRYSYRGPLYGHFGDGCIHTRTDFDLQSVPGIRKYRAFVEEAADLVIQYGGSLSGEHGDGQSRAELLPKMFGTELMEAFREFKRAWDPDGKMNPGKVVEPYLLDENLRLGTDYKPPQVETHFQFPADEGSFANAALRCAGVGECRRAKGGVMCPSYMATKEEMHSTRGRAHLLFEMMRGDPLTDRWRNEPVKEALDLCLSCKGCKTECPVNVDMATYKAEFLSHYFQGKLRPATAYSMGLIPYWARIGSYFPQLSNALSSMSWVRILGGISLNRTVPRFASETFREWFQHRKKQQPSQQKVLLWPDTFANYFEPEITIAACEFLGAAGYQVLIPSKSLCCGRPLYDFGMLPLAKKFLRRILHVLQEEIRDGIPVIGLEPGCVSVFRDELINLFPDDPMALRLHQNTYLLSEFLVNNNVPLPSLKGKALAQIHCHHRSLLRSTHEIQILAKTGLDLEVLDAGCCGMAGAFGFEKKHAEFSIKIGEMHVLPAIRNADESTLIVANGFSCREQIRQQTGRTPVHLAQILIRRAGVSPSMSGAQV